MVQMWLSDCENAFFTAGLLVATIKLIRVSLSRPRRSRPFQHKRSSARPARKLEPVRPKPPVKHFFERHLCFRNLPESQKKDRKVVRKTGKWPGEPM